jgi:hypothetical protein
MQRTCPLWGAKRTFWPAAQPDAEPACLARQMYGKTLPQLPLESVMDSMPAHQQNVVWNKNC